MRVVRESNIELEAMGFSSLRGKPLEPFYRFLCTVSDPYTSKCRESEDPTPSGERDFKDLLTNLCEITNISKEILRYPFWDHPKWWRVKKDDKVKYHMTLSSYESPEQIAKRYDIERLADFLFDEWTVSVFPADNVDVYWCKREYPQPTPPGCSTILFSPQFYGRDFKAAMMRCFKQHLLKTPY